MTFELSDDDCKRINEFIRKQDKVTGGEYGAIGGAYTYHFTPTSLGVAVVIENTVTKAELDLTDYYSW